jgi:hypothetical protein
MDKPLKHFFVFWGILLGIFAVLLSAEEFRLVPPDTAVRSMVLLFILNVAGGIVRGLWTGKYSITYFGSTTVYERKRSPISYWGFLLVPTVLVGYCVIRIYQHFVGH